MAVEEYKCPNCGGAVSFDSTAQQMKCPYCEATFEVAAVRQYAQQTAAAATQGPGAQWETYTATTGNGDWQAGEVEGMRLYRCPSCGGQIMGDANTAATHCPFCGNAAILTEQVSGTLRPDFVIPFKYDKAAAEAALAEFYEGKWLLPRSFKSGNRIHDVTGIYVPFWLFECDTWANMRYRATNVMTWQDSNNRYIKTDHFVLTRTGTMGFKGIPVDGSSKMDDTLMESIEPYDYTQTVPFDTAYLSGYYADKYDVDADSCEPRATERVRSSVDEVMRQTCVGYASVTEENADVRLTNNSVRYALLPIWMLNTIYDGQAFTFAMNGQTGQMVGDLPCDRGRFWATFAAIALVVAIIAFIVIWLVWG